jgi:hypothetical protein
MEPAPILHQSGLIIRQPQFPARQPLQHLHDQAEWDAAKVAAIDTGESPPASLAMWCAIAAAGMFSAVACGLIG